MRNKAGIFFALLVLATVSTASAFTTLTVGMTGSGANYIADGTDDHIQINQALTAVSNDTEGGVVYLMNGTYVIDQSVKIGNNTTLTNYSTDTAVIKLANNAGWAVKTPMITSISTGTHDITVSGIYIDGNSSNNTNVTNGHEYYDALYFAYCDTINVNHVTIYNNTDDALQVNYCTWVTFANNVVTPCGHDCVQARYSTNLNISDNYMILQTNVGVRLDTSDYASVSGNIMDGSQHHCGAGIQLQNIDNNSNTMTHIYIHDNTIYGTVYPGIFAYSTKASGVNVANIDHNVIYGCGTGDANTGNVIGGIFLAGWEANIINNTIDVCYGAGVRVRNAVSNGTEYAIPTGTGYDIVLKNNIITNSLTGNGSVGCAVENMLPTTHSIVMSYNGMQVTSPGVYFGNSGAGISASNSTLGDPLYASASGHDYHLKSTAGRYSNGTWVTDTNEHSPCIDAGDPSYSYSSEPENNGNQINLGRFGDSIEASKSNRGYKIVAAAPSSFALGQNVPNPFNPATTISYTVASERLVTLKIFSLSGQLVDTLVEGVKVPGTYSVTWKPSGLASGVYFCRLQAGDFTQTNKMIFMK